MTAVIRVAQQRPTRSLEPSPHTHFNSNSPRKRRKYIPGEPGGVGMFMDDEKLGRLTRSAPQDWVTNGRAASPPSVTPRLRRDIPRDQATYTSAATAAAAVTQADSYKPREERGWEDFHPDLDIETRIPVFSAGDVDGIAPLEHQTIADSTPSPSHCHPGDDRCDALGSPLVNGGNVNHLEMNVNYSVSTPRRRPGRPPRRPESMLSGLGSPPAPKIVPIPAQNPRERLNLPKPSYRKVDPFSSHEQDQAVQLNYVDRTMASVGFQESDMFSRPEKKMIRLMEEALDEDPKPGILLDHDGGAVVTGSAAIVNQVEYDMDEQDGQWLDAYNIYRREKEQVDQIKPAIFEITMTQIEKEWHALEKRIPKPHPKPPQTHRPRSSSAAAVNGELPRYGEEQDSKCAICDDGDCENTNAIVFCDGCDLAVHQECYGVPFIPEGQWLCRKCQNVGRGIPICVFCPNTDGAFKLTNENRWAHLTCAIWIPEVSLGNTTFQEPIMDVALVPKNRWKLVCYICNQKMGACIQCSNKNCYLAFHVTCAKRAKLFLKVERPPHGGPTSPDAVRKAFCEKHVPAEWRREHDVDTATADAKDFYCRMMRGRRWADSQQSALALIPSQHFQAVETMEDAIPQDIGEISGTVASQKRKRAQSQKNVWRLPSGAPIVPQIVVDNVEASLQRFSVRKRKEFLIEACKYWTLKREARRGAPLLKRLQLQMEIFSSTEITRRNFASMGVAGGPRLQRRIDFAGSLMQDMLMLKQLCGEVKRREFKKLRAAELLKDVVDTVYFPIPSLLGSILEKAQKLDSKGIFTVGLQSLENKLKCRVYTSVATFSMELRSVFCSVVGLDFISNAIRAHKHLTTNAIRDDMLTGNQREGKKLAKRILRAIQQPLQEALYKEAELTGKPFETRLRGWGTGSQKRDNVPVDLLNPHEEDASESETEEKSTIWEAAGYSDVHTFNKHPHVYSLNDTGITQSSSGHETCMTREGRDDSESETLVNTASSATLPMATVADHRATKNSEIIIDDAMLQLHNEMLRDNTTALPLNLAEPLTPPRSEKELLAATVHGGIPWYLDPFDPVGTTIHEERWTGREVMRAMTEELSEIDEEEMMGLQNAMDKSAESNSARLECVSQVKRPTAKKRKRPRQW